MCKAHSKPEVTRGTNVVSVGIEKAPSNNSTIVAFLTSNTAAGLLGFLAILIIHKVRRDDVLCALPKTCKNVLRVTNSVFHIVEHLSSLIRQTRRGWYVVYQVSFCVWFGSHGVVRSNRPCTFLANSSSIGGKGGIGATEHTFRRQADIDRLLGTVDPLR